jgi:hypothetical protein
MEQGSLLVSNLGDATLFLLAAVDGDVNWRLTIFSVFAEVDEAVAEARTGGRGVSGNGAISSALAQEHKKDGAS